MILFFTIVFSSALADEMQSMQLLKDINHSFSGSNIHIDLKLVSVEDIEQNATIMSEVDVYLKLLPSYLEQTPIFSKELYQTNEYMSPMIDYVLSYQKMLVVSLIHLKMLMAQNNYDDVSLVLQAHLQNLFSLVEHTNNFVDFVDAIIMYQKIYEVFSERPQYCTVFKDNPVPPFEEFYRINELKKSGFFEMAKEGLLNDKDVEFHDDSKKQILENTWKRMKYYYNQYDECYLKALKSDNSAFEKENCDTFLSEERRINRSFLPMILFFYEDIKAILQLRYVFVDDTIRRSDYAGKTLALLSYTKWYEIAQDYKKILAQYQKLAAECRGFEKTE